jgi:hypothetical protein
MKKVVTLFLLMLSITGCSNHKNEAGINNKLLEAGTAYADSMQQSVDNNDNLPAKQVDNIVQKVVDASGEVGNLNKTENKFIELLADMRIAYDDVVYNRNEHFNKNNKLSTESDNSFVTAVAKYEKFIEKVSK